MELERPLFCEGCPALASVCPKVNAEATAVTSDERGQERKKRVLKFLPPLRKIVILYATVTHSDNPSKNVGDKVRIPVRLGLGIRNREEVISNIERCKGPRRGFEDQRHCPAIEVLLPSKLK